MKAVDALAFRVEWLDRGPFWDNSSFDDIKALALKVAVSKNDEQHAGSTFLEHYVFNADSPWDCSAFEQQLTKSSREVKSMRFGFCSAQTLSREFALHHPPYLRQFQALLERPEFSVKALLVKPLAKSKTEILYLRNNAVLVEEVSSWSDFCRL